MNFSQTIQKELDKIHANHQLRKITTRMAEEIELMKQEHIELKERVIKIEGVQK